MHRHNKSVNNKYWCGSSGASVPRDKPQPSDSLHHRAKDKGHRPNKVMNMRRHSPQRLELPLESWISGEETEMDE